MTSPDRLDVLLVDDHRLFSESMSWALRAQGLTSQVADLTNRQLLIEEVRTLKPALVLLDLDLGGALGDGVTLVRPFHDAGSAVLVLTGSVDRLWSGAALEQGAVGVRSKSGAFDAMLADIVAASRGEPVMTAADRSRMLEDLRRRRALVAAESKPFERLSEREEQVLRALGRGQTVAQTADAWVLSEATVRSQVRGVLTKLGVGSQLEAVALALRVGWLQPPDRGYRSASPVSADS